MKTITTYAIILMTLFYFSLSAHEEFYKRTSPGSCDLTIAYRNYHSCDMLSWQSYTNIGIVADWITDFPYMQLNSIQAESQFADVIDDWNTAATWDVFSIQSAWENYSRVRFINSTDVFPMPANQYTYGGTKLKFETINGCEQILISSSQCILDGSHTTVFLNNTTGRQFVWRQDNYIPSIDYADFEFTVSHELGHVLGLAHCIYEYPNTIMHAVPPYGNFVDPAPKIHDLVALNILNTIVSIEDYIWIDLEYDYYNVNQTYVGANTRNFVDVYPYGDYIVSWGPWKIEALHGCGRVLVFETQYNGYIYIPPLPDGYLWQRDANGRVKAYISTSGIDNTGYNHYAEAQTAIGNVPNTFITQGTLTSNTNWRGCITITGNITVPSGITLTIHPNSIIVFQNNASLIVNGTLNAQSCELQGGLNTWGSVTFSGSGASSSLLNGVVLKNGIGIRCLNGANVNIQNSTIDHCTEGIYFYNSQPNIQNNQIIEPVQNGINGDASGMSIEILNNTITKSPGNPNYHHQQGIILGNSTNGYVAHNDISGFAYGIYIGGGSDAYLADFEHTTFNPNNRFRDNVRGMTAGWGGYIFAGLWKSYGKYNSIYDNAIDATSYQYSTIYADFNWWGTDGAQLYVDGTSTLLADYPLSYDPWEYIQQEEDGMNIISVNYSSPTDGDGFNPDSSILIGIYLEAQGRILAAVLHYKQMITDNSYPGFALRRLVAIKNRYQIQNIRDYVAILLNGNQQFKPIVMTLFAGILLEEDKYNLAMLLYSQIINQYPNTYYAVNAIFEKFFAALNYENDRVLAEQLLQELVALGLTDEEYLMRLEIAENMFNVGGSGYFGKNAVVNQISTEVDLPKEFALLGNYPNPFNPSTTISYALPYQSSVDLVIYDIMGREIKAFSLPVQSSGYQTIVWDGTNGDGASVSTGVYLYRISIKSLENKEVFVKTSKLMLLK